MHKYTPPLGWNTWNTFGPNINEALILESADAMVDTGLLAAGYEYIVIDDIWALKERDSEGKLVPDPEKFPHGMKYVSDYVHAKGLKFGMYSCAGYLTCAGYPASYDYEWTDAKTFAEWGVDFLKYDFCFHPTNYRPDLLYKRMGMALANCGRDILFSACSWGAEHTRQWIKETGAVMWRSTGDVNDSWASIKDLSLSQLKFQEYNGLGCFNDMDMLVVGMNGAGNVGLTGCTFEEYKTHFSLWALLNSPLMIGCDIRKMDENTKQILMNEEILKINQDPAGREPFFVNNEVLKTNENRGSDDPYYQNYPLECPIVGKFLDNGDVAIGMFNFTDEKKNNWSTQFPIEQVGLPLVSGKKLELTDLWTGEKILSKNGMIRLDEGIEPHTCRMFRGRVVD